jgi:dipeptidyl-peptidase 4
VDRERQLLQSVRRPSFDHERLAKALQDFGIEAKPNALPLTSIDTSRDGMSVKFRIGEKTWEFRDNKTLAEYKGEIKEDTLKPMPSEQPSVSSQKNTFIIFTNRTKKPISLFWIDFDGNPKQYATVEAGKSNRMQTYSGHVWRVTYSETDQLIASFQAQDSDAIVVIEEKLASVAKTNDSSSETAQLPQPKSSEKAQQQARQALVKDYNVWIQDTDGREIQLSTSGTENNRFDYTIYGSPDRQFAVVYQYTSEQNRTVYEVESSPKDQVQPRLKEFQYLKPGDNIRVDRPKMFDLTKKKEVTTDSSLFQNPYSIQDMGWSLDSQEYRFLYNQRGHQVLRLVGMNIQGKVRSIIEENSKTFVDYLNKNYYHEIRDSNDMIWASERDGWNHLYLFDLKTGKLRNQITRGEWTVRSVDKVDEKRRQIWLKAFAVVKGQDPYYSQLVRVNFDGSGFTILTNGDGTHTWTWSPDHKHLIDTWSRVDLAPKSVLRDGETGKQIVALEENSLDTLVKAGWTRTERFAAGGRDGATMIYGIIIRPSQFDVNKKYPIIEQIYAGPQDFHVPKAFSTLVTQHELAELGFVVVQIDGMGTNWRSKAFHDRCYKDLKDAGLPDRVAWMTTAVSDSRPWMDLSRVGIYGGSAGGQSAMGALLWHGDFYRAAAADCGCHDNRMDKLWWNEQWMGWPVDQSYQDSSNVVHAGQLRGALMLIVGELDDNVDPASTMQVVNALNEAEKDYDLLIVPGAGHGVGSNSKYAVRRQQDFFVRHLMGVEPPKRNAS